VVQKHEEMLDKMRQVEAEYNLVKQPLYAARADVIRRVPGFWLHCFLQHADIRLILGAVDQDILAFRDEVDPPPPPLFHVSEAICHVTKLRSPTVASWSPQLVSSCREL